MTWGASRNAEQACRGLELYKKTAIYGDLRRIFAHLSWIVSEGNESNKQACLATKALALMVFPKLNEYQKLFVAISVTSIYAKANISIPQDWINVQKKYAEIVQKNYNQEAALEAGLAFIDLKSEKTIVKPIPEYSA